MADIEAFVLLVAKMRSAQKKFFKTRQPYWLEVAKKKEAQVDKWLKEWMEGQGKLF
jgi:hypothetical protein